MTSERAIFQIVGLDSDEVSTFDTLAKTVGFEPEGHEADALCAGRIDVRLLFLVSDGSSCLVLPRTAKNCLPSRPGVASITPSALFFLFTFLPQRTQKRRETIIRMPSP